MNNDIKIILFDLGRVLMHIDFDAFPNALGLFTEEQRTPYRPATAKLWRLYETGKMSTGEFLESQYAIFDGRYSKEKILDAWNAIIVDDNTEIVPLVQKVQKKYTTAILSNTSESHWEKAMRISPLIRSFPHAFTSFQLGAMKPDCVVYEKVCTSLNVQPHEILFIDDLKENVDSAIAAGVKGVVFRGATDIELQLKNYLK